MTTDFQSDDELVGAAVIGATDEEARGIVERLLAAAGIDSYIEGSVVYHVQVRPSDLERVRAILRSSTELEDHWIQFSDEEGDSRTAAEPY
jgi:hypothetical protein